MLKKCIKYIAVCLAVCCAFLLGIQWKARKMEELLAIIKEQKSEMADCKQEKDEIFKSFFIVDDDTMVLAADGAYFWMERVEHEWDYEVREIFQEYD